MQIGVANRGLTFLSDDLVEVVEMLVFTRCWTCKGQQRVNVNAQALSMPNRGARAGLIDQAGQPF